MPIEQKDIVISTMKDPYMFDFINYTEDMLETDIENELVRNVTSLLMELGTGFAFMGQQYHLEIGGKDFYIDYSDFRIIWTFFSIIQSLDVM